MPSHVPTISVPPSAAAQRRRFSAAYSLLERAIAQGVFPGAAFAVLSGLEIAALDGVGRFTYEADAPLITPSTVYDLASLTKVLATTAMAMLLEQRGQLSLEQPLYTILPQFLEAGDPPELRKQITLRLLLTHASGLPGYARLFLSSHDAASLFDACLALPLAAVPGTRSEYSDPGFILLGRALEMLAGETLGRFCAREVYGPLGMESTRFLPPPVWRSSIPPTEEDRVLRHRIVQGEVQDENAWMLGGVSGHAGLFSNSLDPLCFVRSLFIGENASTPGAENFPSRIFNQRTIQLFTKRSGVPPGSSRALGWDTPSAPSSSGRFFSAHSVGHLGYSGTSLWADFERQIAVVLLTNRTWPHRQNEAIRLFRPLFHDLILEELLRGEAGGRA